MEYFPNGFLAFPQRVWMFKRGRYEASFRAMFSWSHTDSPFLNPTRLSQIFYSFAETLAQLEQIFTISANFKKWMQHPLKPLGVFPKHSVELGLDLNWTIITGHWRGFSVPSLDRLGNKYPLSVLEDNSAVRPMPQGIVSLQRGKWTPAHLRL